MEAQLWLNSRGPLICKSIIKESVVKGQNRATLALKREREEVPIDAGDFCNKVSVSFFQVKGRY